MALFGHVEVALDVNAIGNAKLWLKDGDATPVLRHTLPIRNQTIGDGYGHYGRCPLGDYFLGEPVPCAAHHVENASSVAFWTPDVQHDDDRAYGYYFTPLLDVYGLWAPYGRAGIGAHGGGSAAPAPFDPQQGWFPTEGCFRLQNADNETLVSFVRYVRAHALEADRAVKFTVAMVTS